MGAQLRFDLHQSYDAQVGFNIDTCFSDLSSEALADWEAQMQI